MKFSELWLREWVNPALTSQALADALTMGGLEVESLSQAVSELSGVIIGEVVQCQPHPHGDSLQICFVNIHQATPLQIVCGAKNVRSGLKVAVALVDACLPNLQNIQVSEIKGIASQGMLCSMQELGLAEENEGIFELPNDAPLGVNIIDYLKLNDIIFDVSITPNRGDCLSILGMAREVAALTQSSSQVKEIESPAVVSSDAMLPVTVTDLQACPRYVGRVIKYLNQAVKTPIWLSEKLRRSGIRSIHPVVDVMNYVMLELGQPMHAFDLAHINQKITVRYAHLGEKITLLNDLEIKLDDQALVIADEHKVLALAGVMGGLSSAVTDKTNSIFLESAYFAPKIITKQRQAYNLMSDSAYRFERGVDWNLPKRAIERATELILAILGGQAGPAIEYTQHVLTLNTIELHADEVERLLGFSISSQQIETYLNALGFELSKRTSSSWVVTVPSYRSDILLPQDLIEEIARLHGYDQIPMHQLSSDLTVQTSTEQLKHQLSYMMRDVLVNRSYHEVLTYSFTDSDYQSWLDPDHPAKSLLNPITSEMTVMRTSLWPGLLHTACYNESYQQERLRLFELGTCFIESNGSLQHIQKIGGFISGKIVLPQWGVSSRQVDFYDIKGDVEILFQALKLTKMLTFEKAVHPALHPGQAARILFNNQAIGWLGALHPKILQKLKLSNQCYLFEFDLFHLMKQNQMMIDEVSKFPEIRRDIAIVVNHAVPVQQIQDTIKELQCNWLKEVFIFDVYQGKGISPGLKSVAIGFVLQHSSRTLIDEEVTVFMDSVIKALNEQLGATLRR